QAAFDEGLRFGRIVERVDDDDSGRGRDRPSRNPWNADEVEIVEDLRGLGRGSGSRAKDRCAAHIAEAQSAYDVRSRRRSRGSNMRIDRIRALPERTTISTKRSNRRRSKQDPDLAFAHRLLLRDVAESLSQAIGVFHTQSGLGLFSDFRFPTSGFRLTAPE